MRATFHQRRRTPGFRMSVRANGGSNTDVPVVDLSSDSELSGNETSDGLSDNSNDEFSDSSDDEPSGNKPSRRTNGRLFRRIGGRLSRRIGSKPLRSLDGKLSRRADDEAPNTDEEPSGDDGGLTSDDGGVTSDDGELSDDERSGGEEDVGTPPPPPPPPPPPSPATSLPPATTTSTISSQPTAQPTTLPTALPTTLLTTTSRPAENAASTPAEVIATTSSVIIPPASSTSTSSRSIPMTSTTTLSPSPSTTKSSSPIPIISPSSSSVLVTITSTSVPLPPQSTSDTQFGSSTDVPQPTNAIRLPSESEDSGSSNSQKAGQIAGATIGSLAAVGLILFAVWLWRRHRNRHSRFSRMLPDETRYLATQPPHPGKARSPSSIMNQLMTAAYEAEDGVGYRDSEQIFDNYANEKKKSYAAPENQNMEWLTAPPTARLRHQSIAARTETTNRTESTWKTWGVLAGSSQPPSSGNWFVDRYFRK